MTLPGTRHSLIVRLNKQHQPSWFEFAAVYEPFLMSLVRRCGVPEKDSQDVVQHIMIAVTKSLDSWSDDGRPESFRRWLNIVSRNVAIKFMQAERKLHAASGGTDMVAVLNRVPLDDNAFAEEQQKQYQHELIVWAAHQVKSEFMESSWQAFHDTMIQQRSVEEVAKELNVTAGSIYMSRSRILARIRKKLEVLQPLE
ncbi:MAG: sigma-70 family RNA polymerase sigma factor [Fuerstiella sp.]